MERVVITGMGAVTPIGLGVAQSWENVLKGVSGVGPVTLFDTSQHLVKIACEVKQFDPEAYLPAKEARRRDRFEWFATAAAQEAWKQAGLNVTEENAGRIGVIYSSAVGGLISIFDGFRLLLHEGPRRVSPFLIPMYITDGPAAMLSLDYGLKGPCQSIVTACASGSDAIGMAWLMIRSGMIDAAITGGCEAPVCDVGLAAFDRLGALSRRNEDYSMTPAPFDKNRDGLVIGEGAGALIIESESHAKARHAPIFAEIAGYGCSADAFHITAPHEHGAGGAQAMRLAVESAGANLEDVDYINAHGTATLLNDLAETKAVKAAFGQLAYNIPVSSTKSMTGHMMGATGAVEAIFCAMAVQQDILPPTAHYQTLDPDCDLDIVPNEPRPKRIDLALSNSFGFGGHNAVLAIRKYR
jgi:beta-ketoacyl-acyl-carrier-protein synthase II